MSSSKQPRRSPRAGSDQAVATTAPVEAPAADPAPTTAEAAVPQPVKTCRNCGRRAVYVTDGISAEPVAYCKTDLPANISREMVQRYQAAQ